MLGRATAEGRASDRHPSYLVGPRLQTGCRRSWPGIKASDNPASWADWTRNVPRGDQCGLRGKRQSGYCVGPFGRDAGSTYQTGCVIAKR